MHVCVCVCVFVLDFLPCVYAFSTSLSVEDKEKYIQLMHEVRKLSQRVHRRHKSEYQFLPLRVCVCVCDLWLV